MASRAAWGSLRGRAFGLGYQLDVRRGRGVLVDLYQRRAVLTDATPARIERAKGPGAMLGFRVRRGPSTTE